MSSSNLNGKQQAVALHRQRKGVCHENVSTLPNNPQHRIQTRTLYLQGN